MNADRAYSGVIVCEPMSTMPTSPSKPTNLSTSRPSTPIAFPSPSKSDALKANPHPYPIRTTSTAVLSRSNSTSRTSTNQYQYQYYVPQSPSKESASSNSNVEGKRGGRHRYSKSLVNLDSGPKPLPAPSTTMTTTLFSHRNRSMSSLSSSGSDSPTKSEEEASIDEDLATKRGRRCRGGKVRGIVASFEERSGPEDEQGSYRRKRTDSDASSVSSASSFGSFTDVKADDGDKLEFEPTYTFGDADATACFDSTPKRNNVARRGEEEEPTMEELLASTPWDDPTLGDAVYDETVKMRSVDVAYSTVTASSIRYSLPIPTFTSLATKRNLKSVQRPMNADDELSVEDLLGLVSNSSAGANAWERDDVGCCTIKHVGDVEDLNAAKGPPPDDEPVARQISPTTTTREVELAQEMSETREMVRALSARVASVEAKIGEMEITAGELEVRGRQLRDLEDRSVDGNDDDDDDHPPPQGQSLPGRVMSTLYRTVFGVTRGDGVGASLVRMVLPFSSPSSSPKSRSREASQTRVVLPMWYKKSWACYLLFLGLGACAFVLREVVRRGMMLRGRRT